jgi:hypothetical protein
MSTVQNLLESAAGGWKNLQNDAARLANKWAKTGLLEGLEETDKNNMSLMLENQAKQLVVENSATGGTGAFTAGTGEQWAGIALPLVRKVFGQIAAKEFVSVQPMNLPSGLVFYLDFQYGTSKNPFSNNGSMYGNTGSQFPFSNPSPVGGLYGAGRFTYSTNQTSSVVNTATVVSASWADLNFDSDLSASAAASAGVNQIKKVSIAASGLPGLDLEAVRGFVYLSGSTNGPGVANNLPAFTTYDGTNVNFFITASTAGTNGTNSWTNGTVLYNKATSLGSTYNVGDFEESSSFSTPNAQSSTTIVIPEVNVKMRSEAIVAKTKKLKAVWTPEFAQDLNAYQALDAEAELTSIMSEYISLEIDLEILDMLIADVPATNVEYWSAINNTTIANNVVSANLGFYNTQGQWFQTLGTKLQKLSNKIHQLTLRGGANFLVCSPTVSTIIESIPGFASNSDGNASKMQYAFGVQKAGNLNSKYNVYKNPYMTENTILVGFRGTQFLEAGAVFAPYIPLIMTPLVYDPETFTPRKGLMTRFAKKMLRPEFYGKIYVNGLNTL